MSEELAVKSGDIAQRKASAEAELATAEPALIAARDAVKGIKKAQLDELRALRMPPIQAKRTIEAVSIILGLVPLQKSYEALILERKLKDSLIAAGIPATSHEVSEQNMLMNQRKNANHPFLFGEPRDANGVFIGEANPKTLVNASGKFRLLDPVNAAGLRRHYAERVKPVLEGVVAPRWDAFRTCLADNHDVIATGVPESDARLDALAPLGTSRLDDLRAKNAVARLVAVEAARKRGLRFPRVAAALACLWAARRWSKRG